MREKSKAGILRLLIPISVLAIVILYLFFNFSVKTKSATEEAVQREFQETVSNRASRIGAELQYVRIAGEMVAQMIKSTSVQREEIVGQYMLAITEKTGAYEAIFYQKDKMCVDKSGNSIALNDKQYFPLIAQLADETQYLYVEDDEITGQAAIMLMVPVPETEAALLLYYPTNTIRDMMKIDTDYGKNAAIAIVNSKGGILIHNEMESKFLENGSLWTNVGNEFGVQVGKMKNSLKRENIGFTVIVADNETRTLVYAPIEVNSWMLVVGVDQSYVDQKMDQAWKKICVMLYQLVGAMLLFVVIFAIIYIFSRVKNEEKSRILRERADTDLLTGLNNKLATENRIKEYIKDNPDTLAMMFVLDIDDFKKINDTMGHAFGDEVLSNLGKRISANFRVTDIIGRTGGDEFTIFLKALKDDSNTLSEAKKLVNFFKGFEVGEYVKYSVSASIGAAVFPADGNDFESLYKAADQALYKAKKRGKNQLAFYDDRDRKE